MRIDNAQFTGSATGTQATANLTGSFTGSGHIDRANTASRLEFSASFGLGIENTFNYNGSSNQSISIDTASVHFIEGVHSASIDAAETGSFLITASISGLTQSFTKGDGSTFEINLPDTSSATQTDTGSFIVSASLSSLTASGLFTMSFTNKKNETINVNLSASDFASTASRTLGQLSNGQGVDLFTFNGSTTTTVGIGTFSASIDSKVNTNSSSIATTVNTVSSSLSASIADIIDGTTTITSASFAITASHVPGLTIVNNEVSSLTLSGSNTILTGSTLNEVNISGSTISGSNLEGGTINNTTITNATITGSLQGDVESTASVADKVANPLSNGTLVDAFTYDGSGAATVDITTFDTRVSGSRTTLSASLTTTDQTISSSVATLSGSASTARGLIVSNVSGAFDAVSASLTTTDQTISSSVAALSASASTSRIALSSSAAAALTAQSASNAIDFVSQSIYNVQTGSFIVNAVTAALQEEDEITFTKGDGTTFPLKFYTGSYVKSVNLATPDATGNVAIALASVQSGTSASMLAASSSNSLNEGDVWVIAGETGPGQYGSASNGITYIYAAGPPGTLFEIASLTEIAADAKYVNVSGDTMTGDLVLPNDPTLAAQAARKNYVDLFYDSSSLKTSTAQLELHKGNGTIDIKSFAGISVSSSVSASHLSQADNVAIRSTTGPTENFIYLKKGTGDIEVAARDNIILNMDTNAGGVGTVDFQLNGTSVADINQAGTGSFAWVNATASVANRVRHDLTNGLGVDAFTYDGVAAAQVQVDTSSAHFTTGASASVASIITANSASAAASTTALSGSVATLSSSYEATSGSVINLSSSFLSLSSSYVATSASTAGGGSQTNVSITGSTVSGSTYIGGDYTGGTYSYTGGDYDYTGGDYSYSGTAKISYTGSTIDYSGASLNFTGGTVVSGSQFNVEGNLTGSLSGSVTSAKTYDAQVETANFNFVQGTLHVVSTAITGTLPASPNVGDRVAFMNLSTVQPLIARNGSNIMASATDLTVDSQYASFQLIYTAATEGWILVGANN